MKLEDKKQKVAGHGGQGLVGQVPKIREPLGVVRGTWDTRRHAECGQFGGTDFHTHPHIHMHKPKGQ